MTFQPFGDAALLINFEQKIAPNINDVVIRLATAIEATTLFGVTFLIPAYCSLTLGYEPQKISFEALVAKIQELAYSESTRQPTRMINIPVCYDTPFSLDMEEVMAQTNCSKSEIIEWHTSTIFRVYMLGFLPGFAYLGSLPEALFCTRKQTPRLRVPPQSVGLAGYQTGIYPIEAPGGWQIIGRTPLSIFDPQNPNPFLFHVGDKVQFQAISTDDFYRLEKEASNKPRKSIPLVSQLISPSNFCIFHFKKSGLQTLVQDKGRNGFQTFGIPKSGALDKSSAKIANWLVGNPEDAPVLEIPLIGPQIEVEGDCQIALTGGNLSAKNNGAPLPMYETITVKTGDILSFGRVQNGCRTYLSVGGVWLVKPWLKSKSALAVGGKNLTPSSYFQKGDQLCLKTHPFIEKRMLDPHLRPNYPTHITINVLPGPEFETLSRYHIGYFFSRAHRITQNSNRMGIRLQTQFPDFQISQSLISSAVIPGTIQVTNAGQAIILLADAQTTGGYLRFLNVITADLGKLAQVKPGEEIWFTLCGS